MHSEHQVYFDILNRIPIERITDHPNILVAASFWEEERYRAARTCYAFMRKIDDMIDDYKAEHRFIGEKDRERFKQKVDTWVRTIRNSRIYNPLQIELVRTINEFRIPLWPIEEFARSMIYDINNDGFPTIKSFLDYSEGATVAPSSIFVHLCGIRKKDGNWQDPLYDVRSASRPCALFSYLVHIIRDFQKDQISHLSYFADDRIEANGLNREMMSEMARGSALTGSFRSLMREYYRLADDYRKQTWMVLDQINPLVEPRYHLSLLIIFNLYLMVFERIDPDKGSFTSPELNPSPREIYDRVYRTIRGFHFQSVNN